MILIYAKFQNMRFGMVKNRFLETIINGEECIEFTTNGKNYAKVIVDKEIWFDYLKDFSWTGIKKGKRIEIKTSVNKQSKNLHRMIIEYLYDELDYWGSTIDHKNNNNLDNRKSNLRIFNTALLNSTNIKSKNNDNMQYIHKVPSKDSKGNVKFYGYKIHYNTGGETYYKFFKSKDEAIKYRDEFVYNHREKALIQLQKKYRDIEFERGLRDKLKAGEKGEIEEILRKYKLI